MAGDSKEVGEIVWVDLTIPNAAEVREFYLSVTGWDSSELEMDGYSDYVVSTPKSQDMVAGICHARGANAELPPHWLIYIKVPSLDASVGACRRHGGKVLAGPKQVGGDRFCVLRDPAGAVFAVIEQNGGEGE